MFGNKIRIEAPPETDDIKVLYDWLRRFYERIMKPPNVLTITASSDDLDVEGYDAILADTTDGNIVIGGLKGGVANQNLLIYKFPSANTLTIENNEGVGTQDIYTDTAADIVLDTRGGVFLVCVQNGASWAVVSDHNRT